MKARRVAGFRSARAAAANLGMKPATYAAHENGTRTFSIADARRYAELYEVSPGWILTGEHFDGDQFSKIRNDTPPEPRNYAPPPKTITPNVPGVSLSNHEIFNFGKHALELLNQLSPAPETGLSKQTISIGEVTIRAMLDENPSPDEEHWEFVAQWQFPPKYVSEILKVAPIDVAIIAVIDDNMSPTYEIDDRLIVDFEQKNFTVDGVYIFRDPEKIHIQRIQREQTSFKLSNDNPANSVKHPERMARENSFEIIGRVCGVIAARR